MKPIAIKGMNVVYAKNQPEFVPLPAKKREDGVVYTCWGMTIRERIRVLLRGRIYLSVMTFNNPLQPLLMSTEKAVEEDSHHD